MDVLEYVFRLVVALFWSVIILAGFVVFIVGVAIPAVLIISAFHYQPYAVYGLLFAAMATIPFRGPPE